MKANRAYRNQDAAVSSVLGSILLVAIGVTMATVVFLMAGYLQDRVKNPTPEISFTYSDTQGTARVATSAPNLVWSNYRSSGCDQSGNLAGQFATDNVTAGDTFTGCSGNTFSLVYVPTNTEAAKHVFP